MLAKKVYSGVVPRKGDMPHIVENMCMAPVAQLVPGDHCPTRRQKRVSLHILREAMERGWCEPILIEEKGFRVLDGMRRVLVARQLGWPYIPAYRVAKDDEDAVYWRSQDCRLDFNGADRLFVYLVQPAKLSTSARKKHEQMEREFGEDFLKFLRKRDKGISVCMIAKQIAKSFDNVPEATKSPTHRDSLRKIGWWIADVEGLQSASWVLRHEYVEELRVAVVKNKPVSLPASDG